MQGGKLDLTRRRFIEGASVVGAAGVLALTVAGVTLSSTLFSVKAAGPAANYIVLYNDGAQVNQPVAKLQRLERERAAHRQRRLTEV